MTVQILSQNMAAVCPVLTTMEHRMPIHPTEIFLTLATAALLTAIITFLFFALVGGAG